MNWRFFSKAGVSIYSNGHNSQTIKPDKSQQKTTRKQQKQQSPKKFKDCLH
jgi:hypothetical protein